jgi:hypothetical protein
MARKEPRQRVNRPATIVVGKNRIPCKIGDVSRAGARLLIRNPEWLPKSFEVEDTFSGTRRRATVAWIEGKCLGVRFEREAELVAHRPALAFGRRKT